MDSKERTLGTRASIFKKTDKAIPELEEPAEDVKRPPQQPKRQRIKATFYLNPEDVLAIDELQSNEFRQTGKKPERSEIVSRAIQVFKEQQV
ncbi:MAG TPA: hypothetical protein G4O13_02645 [Dehalococcoidia bacterium]|nr:hypothetical protein [Dehalococcoidia bacterium]